MNTVAILPISNASGEKSYHAVSGNNNLYEAMKDICQWIMHKLPLSINTANF
ncbi:hypothetical protein [Anabaena sp. AL93]|jgi:hypothetical protein|uniref:hypothetical protein n=1 Tax=Anabaena sp. AL93 TaxID=1678133 RepID=UPI0025B7FB5B|nr:hypothetical protein [Anabaena sp. AL93]MBO1071183.1 hypothetical protein [Dolichospermum sp. DEX189]MCX5982596.1 hypothetical protein [Nostocales cyanobacterium LacPavin_0920_SED1_MAG_38_18]